MQRILKRVVFALPLVVLLSCTQGGKVKETAANHVREKKKTEYTAEAASIPSSLNHLKATYIRVLTEKTLIEIDDVEISGETASAVATVKFPSTAVRQSLREIIQRLNPAKQEAFNVPDALNMVGGQMQDPLTTERASLKLKKDDGWRVVN